MGIKYYLTVLCILNNVLDRTYKLIGIDPLHVNVLLMCLTMSHAEHYPRQHAVTQVDPDKPVLVAGDPELKHMAYCAHLGGIPYHPNVASLMVCILSYKNKMSVYVIMVEAYIMYYY